ncbi:hypothetical protein Glove_26g119 [Diversispora epigaea]|uniref:Uncharacterized protein n=1 Tax=Diversispora epigaea TaxID=1348612 RepID=A0A397JLE4_9GLOM|nr:hypothetical protein Glove_26g119 [Diversispora epigaea]
MDETRNNYCLEVESSKWSLPNFLEWRSDFCDFANRKIENINWKKQLKKVIVNKDNLYDESMVNKARDLLSDFKDYKDDPEVKEFWRQHGGSNRVNFSRSMSPESGLQLILLDRNYNLLLELKVEVLKLKMDLFENNLNYVKLMSCMLVVGK